MDGSSSVSDGRGTAWRSRRPSWAELDFGRLRHNVHITRRRVGPKVKIYFVCKGDGFGHGAVRAAQHAAAAGVDGLCAGSPEEAAALHAAKIDLPILLFASVLPGAMHELARLGVRLTIHSLETLEAVLHLPHRVDVHVEVDVGLGRFGLDRTLWRRAFTALHGAEHVRVHGIYSHLSTPEDAAISAVQARTFEEAAELAASCGLTGLERMLASSRVLLDYPEYHYEAVDPGRCIYGAALDARQLATFGLQSTLRAIKARIIQVRDVPAGTELGIGYGAPLKIERNMRTAVIPIGHWDGLNNNPPYADVLVHGERAAVVGRRTFQHTLIDVTNIPAATVGDEAVILGVQGRNEITPAELAEKMGIGVVEMIPRLLRSLPHVHVLA